MGTLRKIGAQTAPKSFQTEKRAVQAPARVDTQITQAAWKGLQTGTLPISGKAADAFFTPRRTLRDTDELRAETLHRNNPAVSLPTQAKSVLRDVDGVTSLPTGAEHVREHASGQIAERVRGELAALDRKYSAWDVAPYSEEERKADQDRREALEDQLYRAREGAYEEGDRSFGQRLNYGVASIAQTAGASLPVLSDTARQYISNNEQQSSDPRRAELAGQIAELGGQIDYLERYKYPTRYAARQSEEWKTLDAERTKLREELAALDVNTPVSMDAPGMQRMTEAIETREKALSGTEGVPRFLGETAISIGQNLALMPTAAISPAVPLAAMGAIAAADKTYELNSRGVAPGEALARGLVSGGIEAATEKIPLDSLLDLVKTGGRSAVRSLLRQMGTEATEESVSYFLNYVADKAAKDPEAKFSFQELAEAAAGGALSGGVLGGGALLLNKTMGAGSAGRQKAVEGLPDGLRGETSFVSLPDGLRQDRAIELLPDFKAAGGAVEAAGTANAQTMGLDTPAPQRAQKTASTGETGTGLVPLTEQAAANLSTGKNNVVARTINDIVSFVKNARSKKGGAERLYMGTIPDSTARLIRDQTGVEVSGYTAILPGSSVQHIFKNHGDTQKEAARGQRAVSAEDIAQIPKVLASPDAVTLSEDTDVFGRPVLLFSKQIGDTYITAQAVTDGRHMLATNTLWIQKKKNPLVTESNAAKSDPAHNAQSVPPSGSSFESSPSGVDASMETPTSTSKTTEPELSSAPIIAESAPGVNTQSAQAGAETSVGAAQAGFTGDTERGYSKNLATDQNMREDIREDFRLDPEMYHRLGNKETLAKAQAIFDEGLGGARSKLEQAIGAAQAGAKLAPEMVPLSRLVANELARGGDLTTARNLLSDVAVELTQAGQLGQAANILRSADPVTVENTIQGALDRVNEAGRKRYGEKWSDFALTDEERQEIAEIDLGDEDAFSAMYEKVARRVGAEMPSTWWEKLTEIRRVSMLLNPKTQVRNVVANVPLAVERKAAERLSGAIQDMLVKWGALDKQDQTRTLRVSRESRALAESLYAENREMLAGSADKWDMNGLLRQYRRYFGESKPGQAMDAVRQFTYDLLEKGDTPFVRSAFLDNAAQYIEAQGYTSLDQVPQKVVDHAAQQAMEATFKDACALASWLNGIKRRGGAAGGAADIILPFTTTPVNILRRTVDYSPAGAVQALLDFRAGRRTDAADDIARALTGTGAILIGMLLAKYGLATGAADDDKDKAALDRATGESPYSLFGRVAYEWAQPVGTQLAMGARIWDAVKDQEEVSDALLNVLYAGGDTLMDMTILSNLQDLLKGYGSPTETVGETLIQGFAGQMTPSLFGAVARTLDGTVRTSYTGGGAWDNAMAGIKAKLPGLSATLPAAVNVKGEENRRVEPLPLRALQEMVNPSSVNAGTRNAVDEEVYRLYEATGGKTMFPQVSPYKIEREGVDVPLTGAERAQFQTTQGRSYYSIIGEMLDSEDYRGMEPEQQVKYFELVNQYAKAVAMEEATDGAYESDRYVELAQTARKELGLSEAEYLLLYTQYGGATMNGDGIRAAYQEGVDPEAYLRYVGELKAVKGDKKSTGQVDAARALLQTEGLTDREREALWGLQGESWKEESNPFGGRCTAIRERFGLDMDTFLDALEIYHGKGKAADKKAALRALIGPQGNALYDQLGKR